MYSNDELIEKEQSNYMKNAKEFLGNPLKLKDLLNKVIHKATEKKGYLGDAWDKLQLFVDLVKAYTKGEYKHVQPSTIVTIIGALLYFVSPIDLVPDFIIGLGIFDDAAVIGFTLKKLSKELDQFEQWKSTNTIPQENPLD
ncbi:methyltransferase type 11 [Bacillus sp. AFS076308]|uniref:YkvA family protein n=1 Tax=unclassified Bacillus (in: firmicutes) TaxID=185979 RepID=UPI000BF85C94|nr:MULTISPECIES: YkvA family protein [unclassified Bacillus (in: firmicutes)]PFO06408.1 methyltransferase type 11 [Bacillus sp. AFS076308]PGV49438.1 methyltransferase type 11 [Bacillus sp. AFS037270]